MLAGFTVDVTDATWPAWYFVVDIVPAIGDVTCSASKPTACVSNAACPPAAAVEHPANPMSPTRLDVSC
ncbi:hypothetical protein ACQEVZ_55585 [Dactylosporangium sp. CA-152071]|uniref:hypothetical protein n=1 Tax=Dactylosporangium sp. CA-152071 TaxID=3239933 RepID=UPI003D8DCE79